MKWIDTHTHLQVEDFVDDVGDVIARAKARGIVDMLICAGGNARDWARCQALAHEHDVAYTLGIHPLHTPRAQESDLLELAQTVERALDDPHFVGIGEIGIDGWVETLDDAKQEHFFAEQLKIAKRFSLPLSVHIRKSGSRLLKYLNRYRVVGGVMHAFNGSEDELARFKALGFHFGFGGASTYDGSQRIRRHLAQIEADRWVLETDAPDIPSSRRRDSGELRTEPLDLLETADVAAQLRGVSLEAISEMTYRNALNAFPRLRLRHA